MLDAGLAAGSRLNMADYHVLALLSEQPDHAMRMNELAAEAILTPSGPPRHTAAQPHMALLWPEEESGPLHSGGSKRRTGEEGTRETRPGVASQGSGLLEGLDVERDCHLVADYGAAGLHW